MVARRLRLLISASLCGLACALALGTAAVAASPLFGEWGEEAGQISGSHGMAIDASGDIYVSDQLNNRIDKFEASGKFLLAWGYGVVNGADELQTCTVSCQRGGESPDTFHTPMGVAVDNNPSSASYGDVYMVDEGGYRVMKFDPSGKFLLTFGGHVNTTTNGNVCVAGEACGIGTRGTGNGEVEWAGEGSYIAVGPAGRVYVGDRARVEVFEPSGAWRENISLAGLSSVGQVTELAVDATGDVYVMDNQATGVREFEPGGLEKLVQFDIGSTSVEAIALDKSGAVFVSDSGGGIHFLKFNGSGEEVEAFGFKTLLSGGASMAFDEALGGLLVYGSSGIEKAGVWAFAVPPPGPLVELGSESGSAGPRDTATLDATVNAEGSETSYRFEYVDEAHFQASGYASASSTPAASIGFTFEERLASAHLTGLAPGATYHYRVVATNANGTATGPDRTFAKTLVEGPWVANVTATSATLAAMVNPQGASTGYRLEYGTSTFYGETVSGSVGEGESYVSVSSRRQDLQPGTTYHYRIVTTSEVGTYEGPDQTFTTQTASVQELGLPDGRAWELVSPPDKKGSAIQATGKSAQMIQAAVNGSSIAYNTMGPMGEGTVSEGVVNEVLSARTAGGWDSKDITIPHVLNSEHPLEGANFSEEYRMFSPDLHLAAVLPFDATRLSPEATELTIYLRDSEKVSFKPLVTSANVPSGTKFGADGDFTLEMHFLGGTPDLTHIVLSSVYTLAPEALDMCAIEEGEGCNAVKRNLYEWTEGKLQLVNILPDGKPSASVSRANAFLGDESVLIAHAISNDGRRIAWQHLEDVQKGRGLYVRDMVEKKTVQLGGEHAVFQTMSSDGSRIFFLENHELHAYDWGTATQTNLTANHEAGERNAQVGAAIIGASKDGSYVYFVAQGVLAAGGSAGEDNLYLAHYVDGVWTTTFIAALSPEDEKTWYGPGSTSSTVSYLEKVSSRISPNGRYLAFMSNRPLTGYDNVDTVSGLRDEEVYLYDATSGRLACTSCNPTGARPIGVFDEAISNGSSSEALEVDQSGIWDKHWLAGSLAFWHTAGVSTLYQPNFLSDNGRLFFESPDALVPQDTNGLEDVYEYESPGIGNCTAASATFSIRSGGCVSLISSGTSSQESAFMDASENGEDAFFITASRLTSADYDTTGDVYDAHVCSAAVPCVAPPVSPPPCATGDSCKAAPSPQPEVFGPTPSATFSGVGNVASSATPIVRPKGLTGAQRRARALKACRRKRDRRKRVACEREALKRYPAKRAHKTNTKGNG